jgi:ATP-dependent RNA helicase MSS116, mitochondrial
MDFPNVSHVIQVGLPQTEDHYIHRVGRTGRAGKSGQGYLLLQEDDRREFNNSFARDLRLKEDDSLYTAKLDMTKGAQLPANIAKLMQYIEAGIRQVPFEMKARAYTSMIGVLKQQGTRRSPQQLVDKLNDYARYGWGLERPPAISAMLAGKMGLMGVRGLEIDQRPPRDSTMDQRGTSDSRGGRRGGFNDRDPFGQGMGGGMGVSRGFGGDSRGGGFGGDSRGGFGGDSRGFGRNSRRGSSGGRYGR